MKFSWLEFKIILNFKKYTAAVHTEETKWVSFLNKEIRCGV